jgi:Domain of unknown function (DUF6883)
VKLPGAERAVVELAKLRDYSLSPFHKEGRHKARVFASALGFDRSDADWLCERLRKAAREQECRLGQENAPRPKIPGRFYGQPWAKAGPIEVRLERAA